MIRKRFILFAVCALLILGLFSGCAETGNTGTTTRPSLDDKQLSVVATVFPAYDWTRQIIGGNERRVALTLLLDKGVDLHSYQPTVEDIYKISTCDVFIYIGGESDKWVPDALAQAENENMIVLNLMETLGSAAREEETLEGMEEHEEHGEHGEHEAEEEGPEYDEHVWLSLRNASVLCGAIEKALETADPDAGESYRRNFEAYNEKLTALDADYTEALAAAQRRTLLFADRFPFLYLAKDYDLNCYAAFSGCSAESEASFETVNFLVGKVDELELPCVMKLENSDSRLAETIVANSKAQNAKILELNSIQSVTARGVEAGVTYLGVMEENLEVLKQALN